MPALRGPEPVRTTASGIVGLKRASPIHHENGIQIPATAVDITPTQSRATSPLRIDLFALKNTLSRERSDKPTSTTLTNGVDASNASVDRSEETGHVSQVTPKLHDSLLSPSHNCTFPSRSITPRIRPPTSPTINGTSSENEMQNSSPHVGSSSGPSRSSPARRQQPPQQQQRQRGQQSHGFYTSPASDSRFSRNPPSVSSQGASPSLAHAQQPVSPQHQIGLVGQYAPSQPVSLYPPHHHQHQYSYPPPLNLASMPPLAHAHSHPTSDFFPLGHSISPTQPPLYAPSFQTGIPPEHSSTPALTFDYDGRNAGRGLTHGPSPSYTPQQPFAPFNFHPTLTTSPQFQQSHSSFSSPFQAHQGQHAQRPQYPPSFAYLSRTSPTTPEDTTQPQPQPSATWWYIQPHSASPATGPYPNMYYLDAYGNPPNTGVGLGHGISSLSSPSATGPMQPPIFPLSEAAVGSMSGSGPEGTTGGPKRPNEGHGEPESAASSSRAPLSPSVVSLGDSLSGRRGQDRHQSKNTSRRSMLPNLPVQRSEWVMWVGNVPSDATHDELWRFFTRPLVPNLMPPVVARSPYGQHLQQPPHLPSGLLSPSGSSSASDGNSADTSGVASVFLIARSNCAFVNYISAAHLAIAVKTFNGIQLRPRDPRCPLLVCRVRGKEEDLKAGVGGQRGTGLHTRWIREQQERGSVRQREEKVSLSKEGTATDTDTTSSEPPGTPTSLAIQTESGAESEHDSHPVRRPPHHSSSSGSTTSGFLARYFPKRYFILKSLTQYDLDLSVEKGVWATQPHNETVLNQAFRNSQDVFLIFGVNKSGEFYGYARMESPIGKPTGDHVSWASRSDSQRSHSPARSLASSIPGNGPHVNGTIIEESEGGSPEGKEGDQSNHEEQGKEKERRPIMLFSPSEHRLAEDSPQPVTPATQKRLSKAKEAGSGEVPSADEAPSNRHHTGLTGSALQGRPVSHPAASAPAVMGPQYRKILPQGIEGEGVGSETLDPRLLRQRLPSVRLDPEAPLRAVRERVTHGSGSEQVAEDEDGVKRRDTLNSSLSASGPGSKLREVVQAVPSQSPTREKREADTSNVQPDTHAETEAQPDPTESSAQWGASFKVQWIRVKKLPFHRTRTLRNPWNHEREVKVSRDGTELEPGVGQALLDEWDKEEPPAVAPVLDTGVAGTSSPTMVKRGSHFRRAQSDVQTPLRTGSEAVLSPGPQRVHQQKERPR